MDKQAENGGELSTQQPAEAAFKHPSCIKDKRIAEQPKLEEEKGATAEATASGKDDAADSAPRRAPAAESSEEAPRPKKKRKKQSYKDLMSSLRVPPALTRA